MTAMENGKYFYSVRTTGVYCRPSCAARPKPENVAFHRTAADAERAGFRACKRCKPDRAEIRFAIGKTSLGRILVAANDRGICAILMGDNARMLARDLRKRFPDEALIAADLKEELAEVVRLVEAPSRALDLELDVQGTPFQQRVWRALRQVPAGATLSYADLARTIGAAGAVRAVAQACGANALAVAVPCHRVVRSDRGLSDYRWGVERKRALLARESGG